MGYSDDRRAEKPGNSESTQKISIVAGSHTVTLRAGETTNLVFLD